MTALAITLGVLAVVFAIVDLRRVFARHVPAKLVDVIARRVRDDESVDRAYKLALAVGGDAPLGQRMGTLLRASDRSERLARAWERASRPAFEASFQHLAALALHGLGTMGALAVLYQVLAPYGPVRWVTVVYAASGALSVLVRAVLTRGLRQGLARLPTLRAALEERLS